MKITLDCGKKIEVEDEDYKEIILKEWMYHQHPIMVDGNGTLRWKKTLQIDSLISKCGINELFLLLEIVGYGKNSEVYRKLYREMGYSLCGYWEVFYWEMNNEEASEYKYGVK